MRAASTGWGTACRRRMACRCGRLSVSRRACRRPGSCRRSSGSRSTRGRRRPSSSSRTSSSSTQARSRRSRCSRPSATAVQGRRQAARLSTAAAAAARCFPSPAARRRQQEAHQVSTRAPRDFECQAREHSAWSSSTTEHCCNPLSDYQRLYYCCSRNDDRELICTNMVDGRLLPTTAGYGGPQQPGGPPPQPGGLPQEQRPPPELGNTPMPPAGPDVALIWNDEQYSMVRGDERLDVA